MTKRADKRQMPASSLAVLLFGWHSNTFARLAIQLNVFPLELPGQASFLSRKRNSLNLDE